VRLNPFSNAARDVRAHHLRPPRRGFDVAMMTRLIALAADVYLQCVNLAASQGLTMCREFLFKRIH
jgi:hypothetical protein